jgi:hypothetical protein
VTDPAAGASSPRKLFGVIDLVGPLAGGRALFLASLGVAIVVLEQAFRWPLQLPGHHGLEAMALLVFGRLSCSNPWSATLVGASAALAAPFVGADHGVLTPLFYVLPGVVIDLGCRLGPQLIARVLIALPMLAALAFATKPVVRVIASQLFGMQFGSMRAGPVYPILTHLMFGFLGALAAALAWRYTERRLRGPR